LKTATVKSNRGLRAWHLLKAFFGATKHRDGAVATARTPQAEEVCIEQDAPGILKNPNEMQDARFWDAWWDDCISKGRAARFMFPMIEAPLVQHAGKFYDVANSDKLLIGVMAQYGLRKVLCAGNGISQEPRALAQAGFDVTALDLSPKALVVASAFEPHPDDLHRFHFCDGVQRPGGQLNFVIGSILDMTVCPGPFDVIIERRTISRFREQDRSTALGALAERLGKVGIFLSHCNDPDPRRLSHNSEAWFREQNWTIWDGAPSSTLLGRVAWLVRSSG
jgi:hypothetical protein